MKCRSWRRLVLGCVVGVLSAGAALAQEAEEGVRVKKFTLEPKELEYFLIAGDGELKTPEHGYKLLMVMPGGDGSAEFRPFAENVYREVLGDDYLLVQLIAPKWSDGQRIVWPTAQSKVRGQKASVEEFVAAAVADVTKRVRVDDQHIYTLSWSSGGPAAYAASLANKTPVTGSFVAMSVFKANELPSLQRRAKGQRYYILHSRDDRVCPFRMAEAARDTLREAGATVEFVEYEGGHGWQGDVFGNLRAGIEWLESQAK